MASGKKHIVLDGHSTAENFAFKIIGCIPQVTFRDCRPHPVRYSLPVSIEVPDEEVDIYSVIENQISVPVEIGM